MNDPAPARAPRRRVLGVQHLVVDDPSDAEPGHPGLVEGGVDVNARGPRVVS